MPEHWLTISKTSDSYQLLRFLQYNGGQDAHQKQYLTLATVARNLAHPSCLLQCSNAFCMLIIEEELSAFIDSIATKFYNPRACGKSGVPLLILGGGGNGVPTSLTQPILFKSGIFNYYIIFKTLYPFAYSGI